MNDSKKICFAAMMIAVGILLPMAFHAIPNAGATFAPMHLPVFVAGFICGPFYGALVGLICPLLSFLFTGMPAAAYLPNMMAELLVYGSTSGLFFRIIKTKHFLLDVYLALIIGMLLGRAVGGSVAYILFLGGNRNTYSWAIFFTSYFVTCWPAIVIQLAVVPTVVTVARKRRFIGEADRYLDSAHYKKNASIQREFFDGLADSWRKNETIPAERIGEILAPITLGGGDRVLDVGCGAGVIDGYLLSRGCKVDAIDISEKMIARAKEAANGVNYFVADFYDYIGGSNYDSIVVFDAYPHFIDKRRFCEKASDLLREGGTLWIAFDDSRAKINGYHKSCNGKISVDLLSADKEAERFDKFFVVTYLRDDSLYLVGLTKKARNKA